MQSAIRKIGLPLVILIVSVIVIIGLILVYLNFKDNGIQEEYDGVLSEIIKYSNDGRCRSISERNKNIMEGSYMECVYTPEFGPEEILTKYEDFFSSDKWKVRHVDRDMTGYTLGGMTVEKIDKEIVVSYQYESTESRGEEVRITIYGLD
tara:strand:+ start:3474 stop:3923 length:450 start_codon:yes stop_codon:yes gene_type:complete